MDDTEKTQASEMTLKQRKWLKRYLECGNASQAAREVYDCKNDESAGQIGYENLKKLDYTEFLEAAGITDDLLQKKMLEGLDATEPISALVIANTETGVVKTKGYEGQIEVPDYRARHKYLETALKLKKRLVDRMDIKSDDKPFNPLIIFKPMVNES